MAELPFKQRVFGEFARIGQALASERRLELLDLLAQAPRRVDALASMTGMSVANVSQHLQILRRARLVETEREGTKMHYRLADESVVRLWQALQLAAETRLPEVGQLTKEDAIAGERRDEWPRDDLERLIEQGEGLLIDVRPAIEYQHGHLPTAVSLPLEQLRERIDELPRDRPIIAYCRGAYCLTADEAVTLLRERGFDAHRVEGGWPEWWAEGRVIASGG